MGEPATDQPLHSTNDTTNKTVSVNGQEYDVLDVGYVYETYLAACMVLEEDRIVISPSSYAAQVCADCWHLEGTTLVPDWKVCSTPVVPYGDVVELKQAWKCHCLKKIRYQSIDTGQIDPTITFETMCGGPKISPPLFAIGVPLAIAGAGLALSAFQRYVDYSGDLPPGFRSDVVMGIDQPPKDPCSDSGDNVNGNNKEKNDCNS